MAEEQKKETDSGKEEFSGEVDVSPKLDPLVVRAIANIYKTYLPFSPKTTPRPIRPNDHYLEFMRLNGWLDLDLDDPDLAPLFK
eukprot:Gb_27508 [translate_table: standard]